MIEDFASAAGRHLDDAHILLNQSRYDNAAYLSGYVVECSLKCLVRDGGLPSRAYGHQLDLLSDQAMSFAYLLSPASRRYRLPDTIEFREVVQNWTPELRYSETGTIDSNRAESWIKAAQETYKMTVVQAMLDGMEV